MNADRESGKGSVSSAHPVARPKLLVLASTYPRWQGDHEPGFVHELAKRLVDDFDVKVLTPHHAGAARNEVMDGVAVRRYRYAPNRLESLIYDGGMVANVRNNPLKLLLIPLFFLAQLNATARHIRRWKPDVIHAHWLVPQGMVLALLSLVLPKMPPFLLTSHGADMFTLRFWPMQALRRFVVRRGSAVTVVSHSMLAAMSDQRIPTDGVRVEPMGVDLQTRFTPDDSVSRLRARVRELGIENKVNFCGAVPQNELPALYRRAAVFVAPFIEAEDGDQEGLGLVTLEAIGCECPILASDLPAVRDILDDACARVPPGQPAKLAQAICRSMSLEPVERASRAALLRQRVMGRFHWRHRAAAYAGILREVLAAGPSAE